MTKNAFLIDESNCQLICSYCLKEQIRKYPAIARAVLKEEGD